MKITDAALDALRVGFKTNFQAGSAAAKPQWRMFASLINSGSAEEIYAFLDRIPRLREWLGDRVIQNLSERSYSLKNKDFELTIGVDRNEIEDDRLGTLAPLFSMMGETAALWPDDLVVEVLQAAVALECHDGQYFFDTDHPIDLDNSAAGTQSNNFTSKALDHTNVQAVRTAMQSLVGRDGRTLGVRPTHLIVPPALEKVALEILNAERLSNGATNVMKGTAQLIAWDRLAGQDTTWYLMDLSKALKPFIFQLRKPPMFDALDNRTDANVFHRKKYLYGVDARGAAGLGLWWCAARAIQ